MILFSPGRPARLCVSESADNAVRLTVRDLLRDLEKVSGETGHRILPLTDAGEGCAVIGTLGDEGLERLLARYGVRTDGIRGRWEHFLIESAGDCVFLAGSDVRGTIYAVYEVCRRFLGVDPLYLFTDHEPVRKEAVEIAPVRIEDGPKAYRFRGWFINDEDLIAGFCRQGVPEKEYDFHRDYAPMLSMIAETALRLRQNLLIPASHIDMDDPAHEALVKLVTDRGLFISMHHQEPAGVNQQRLDRWFKARGDLTENINFADHPEKYRQIWRHFIRKWARYPNVIWQLGLRGRGDRPVWYQNDRIPDTAEARGALISRALQEQWNIIAEETGRKDFLSSTTLWMEGMPLYRAGALKFPGNTMVILSDFGPDQMWGDEYYDTPRLPGVRYGGYYHVCFWGCGPHLVQGNRPEKILYNMEQANRFGDTAYSILNVSNIREHVFGIYNMSRATWDPDGLIAEGLTKEWCEAEFELPDGADAAGLYRAYFDSFAHLDDSRIPGRMLLMDGMCRRVALMLMQILAGEELKKVDIQNKRLFDFEDTDAFIDFYRNETKAGIRRFESVLEQANGMLPRIPEGRRAYFRSSLVLQTGTILSLYRWVNALCEAVRDRRGARDDAFYRSCVEKAVHALERVPELRKDCTGAFWAHWWDGDTLIDFPGIIRATKELMPGCGVSGDLLSARF